MIGEYFDPYSRISENLKPQDREFLFEWLKELELCLTQRQKNKTHAVQVRSDGISCTGFDLVHLLVGPYCRIRIGFDYLLNDLVAVWHDNRKGLGVHALRTMLPQDAADILWPSRRRRGKNKKRGKLGESGDDR